MSFGYRIKDLRNKKGLTQLELSRVLGVTDVAISRWELDENKPREKTLLKLAEYFEVSYEWLKNGINTFGQLRTVSIPFFNDIKAACGCGGICLTENQSGVIQVPNSMLKNITSVKNLVSISVYGESMIPVICDNSIIVIDTGAKIIQDGKIYVVCHQDLLRVKMIYLTPSGIRVSSYNKTYPDEFYNKEELSNGFNIVGKVIWYSSYV